MLLLSIQYNAHWTMRSARKCLQILHSLINFVFHATRHPFFQVRLGFIFNTHETSHLKWLTIGVVDPARSAACIRRPTRCRSIKNHWREVLVGLKSPAWRFVSIYAVIKHMTWPTYICFWIGHTPFARECLFVPLLLLRSHFIILRTACFNTVRYCYLENRLFQDELW